MLVIISMTMQNLIGLRALKGDWHPKDTWLPGMIRVSFLPIGLLVLFWLDQIPDEYARAAIGAFLLIAIAMQFVRVRKTIADSSVSERPSVRSFWLWIAFGSSGFCQGTFGMSGPPIVLWAHAQPWKSARIRSFLFTIYLIGLPPQLLMWFVAFPERLWKSVAVGVVAIPAALVGASLGIWIGNLISTKVLRQLTLSLLVLLAVMNIASLFLAA